MPDLGRGVDCYNDLDDWLNDGLERLIGALSMALPRTHKKVSRMINVRRLSRTSKKSTHVEFLDGTIPEAGQLITGYFCTRLNDLGNKLETLERLASYADKTEKYLAANFP